MTKGYIVVGSSGPMYLTKSAGLCFGFRRATAASMFSDKKSAINAIRAKFGSGMGKQWGVRLVRVVEGA